jgi:predicted alpha/beta superfamily hydrolase
MIKPAIIPNAPGPGGSGGRWYSCSEEINFTPGKAVLTIFISRRKEYNVTFEVVTPDRPDAPPVYIIGNHPQLGNWDPVAVPLERDEDGVWRRQFTFRKNVQLEYKFSRGSWDTEAVNEGGKSLHNFHLKVDKDAVRRIDIPHWKDEFTGKKNEAGDHPEDRISGTVKFHRQVKGEGLLPRDVIVWLPPGYESKKKKRFPVLYMHDGQNVFDPVTSYTGVDWQADETATRLIEEGKMQEIIIVGIYNTDDRLEEYSDTPKGKRYREFLTGTLKPFIDKNYRTMPEGKCTATMGSSMGGLVSFLLVWHHANIFSKAGCLSPSFVFHKYGAIKMLRKSPVPGPPVQIYMDCGGTGGEKLLYRGCKKVLRILRRKGITPGENFHFFYDRHANHSENAWSARLRRPLQFMFGVQKDKE